MPKNAVFGMVGCFIERQKPESATDRIGCYLM